MTLGPALILLSAIESISVRFASPMIVFGRVPFFFYILHLYVIHALALLLLMYEGRGWHQSILSARGIMSGALRDFGLNLGAVYVIWIFIVILLYPLCRRYQQYRESHPAQWWLSYL
jgi:hypothetical protein